MTSPVFRIAEAAERAAPVRLAAVQAWPALDRRDPMPAFPVDALPDAVRAWVTATATATQTPVDLAACAALGVLSASVCGTVEVDVAGRWREEVCLYIVCALESGDRKSAVLRAATAPLRAVEQRRAQDARPVVARARAERDAAEQRRKALTARAAKCDDPAERTTLTREAGDVGMRLDADGEPHVPRLLADDATPEALAGLLAAHGRIAILAAESAFLDNLGGRYADGRANLHLACQAYTGEATTVDRRGRDPERLDRPLLTLALCVQPHVLAALAADPTARDQGLVARCLLARPRTLLGMRTSNPPSVPAAVTDRWTALVERLTADRTDTTPRPAGSVSSVGRLLTMSAEAVGLIDALHDEREHRLAEDGDLRPLASWHARYAGRAIRVAALLHLAGNEPGDTIAAATLRKALAIGRVVARPRARRPHRPRRRSHPRPRVARPPRRPHRDRARPAPPRPALTRPGRHRTRPRRPARSARSPPRPAGRRERPRRRTAPESRLRRPPRLASGLVTVCGGTVLPDPTQAPPRPLARPGGMAQEKRLHEHR